MYVLTNSRVIVVPRESDVVLLIPSPSSPFSRVVYYANRHAYMYMYMYIYIFMHVVTGMCVRAEAVHMRSWTDSLVLPDL